MQIGRMLDLTLSSEIIYSYIIIICSLIIYFGTKKIYDLSSHGGIKYFRQTFLLISIGFFSRTFIKFLIFYLEFDNFFDIARGRLFRIVGNISQFIFIYISIITILYLSYSIIWKKWKDKKGIIIGFHIFTLIISSLSLYIENIAPYVISQIITLSFLLYCIYSSHKKREKKNRKKKSTISYLIYFLIAGFWLLNSFEVIIPNLFNNTKIIIYLSSITLFMIMLYKVLITLGSE